MIFNMSYVGIREGGMYKLINGYQSNLGAFEVTDVANVRLFIRTSRGHCSVAVDPVEVTFETVFAHHPNKTFLANGTLDRSFIAFKVSIFDVVLARPFLLELCRTVGTGVLGLRGVNVQVNFEISLRPVSFESLVANGTLHRKLRIY
jgi:hypothetical protein